MVTGLVVLNSGYVGSRDLWWPNDATSTVGYNVYRAFDYPNNWVKLNASPIPGQFYRDITTLTPKTYTITDDDWIEKGTFGRWGFKIPDIPYSGIVATRPMVASSPDDVSVILTDINNNVVQVRPAFVSGIERSVWINTNVTLPTGGAVSAFPITDMSKVQLSLVQASYKTLTNFVDIYSSMTRTYYTVVPVGDNGEVYAAGSAGDIVNTQTIERVNYMLQEQIRRNAWVFERVGEPAFIMFRMSRGIKCSCAEDGVEEPRHGCPICYETGWVGGYYGPYDIVYTPPDTATNTTVEEGGRKVERVSKSYLGPTPIIQNGDLIVRKNGERLITFDVTYTQPQGAIAQQEFNVRLLNNKDTRYLIPVVPGNPIPGIFNPVTQTDPTDGSGGTEPVFQKENSPDTPFENTDKQPGRTVVWGAIQT